MKISDLIRNLEMIREDLDVFSREYYDESFGPDSHLEVEINFDEDGDSLIVVFGEAKYGEPETWVNK